MRGIDDSDEGRRKSLISLVGSPHVATEGGLAGDRLDELPVHEFAKSRSELYRTNIIRLGSELGLNEEEILLYLDTHEGLTSNLQHSVYKH